MKKTKKYISIILGFSTILLLTSPCFAEQLTEREVVDHGDSGLGNGTSVAGGSSGPGSGFHTPAECLDALVAAMAKLQDALAEKAQLESELAPLSAALNDALAAMNDCTAECMAGSSHPTEEECQQFECAAELAAWAAARDDWFPVLLAFLSVKQRIAALREFISSLDCGGVQG